MFYSKLRSCSETACILLLCALASAMTLQAQTLNSNLPPSGNFDLSHWKLQLPTLNGVLTGASTGTDSTSATALVGGWTNAYFYTGPDGAMTFWAPNNGARTSGSTHPRSELREQIVPGDDNSNWTLHGTHILTGTCVVSNVPSDTGKVVIGQMHEPNYKTNGSPSAGNEHLIMFDLFNSKIYVNISPDGDSGSDFSKTFITGAANVALGKPINYTMSIVDGLLQIVINNVTNSWGLFSGTNFSGLTFQNWDAASGNTLYFKAGSYNQTTNACNCSTNGAKVVFYALTTYHAPSITNQPASITVASGSTTNFSVQATGNGTLTYQWRLNGTNLTINATSATLNLTNVQSGHAGNYSVRVADTLGAVTSVVATLTVTNAANNNPPTFTSNPINKSNAAVNVAYNGSLAGDATDPDVGEVLTFSKVSGPSWLSVAGNGNLSGTPGAGDVGTNNWTVRVTDSASASNQATLRIIVNAASSGGNVTNVVVNDSWTDGGRNNGADAQDTDWWTSTGSTAIEVGTGYLGLVSGNSGRGIHGTFASQTLNVGETLTATFTFTTPATVGNNTSTGFRAGLFDTTGKPGLAADISASSGTPNAIYNNLNGYLTDWDVNTGATADTAIRVRSNAGSGQLMATTADYTSLGDSADAGYVFAANTSYVGIFSITRTSSGLELTGSLYQGPSLLTTHTVTDSNPSTFAYGMLAFHANSSAFGSSSAPGANDNGIDFTNIKIEVVTPATIVPPAISLQPASRTNIVGTTATFNVTATGTEPLTYQWQKNFSVLSNVGNVSGATTNLLSLLNVADTDAADYRVIVSNSAGSVTSIVASLTVNRPPSPGSYATVTGQAIPISISIAGLLAVASDPDGDSLGIPSVNPASANGGSVLLTNAVVWYTPASGFVGGDQWTYQLTDARGASSNGIVGVTVVSSNAITLNVTSQSMLPNRSFMASFTGVPGLRYTVDRATNVTGPWELGFTNVLAGTNGVMQFTDPNTSTIPERFYRTRYP